MTIKEMEELIEAYRNFPRSGREINEAYTVLSSLGIMKHPRHENYEEVVLAYYRVINGPIK